MRTELAEGWWWLLPVGQIELMAGGIIYGGLACGLILVGAATVLAALVGYAKGDGDMSRGGRSAEAAHEERP